MSGLHQDEVSWTEEEGIKNQTETMSDGNPLDKEAKLGTGIKKERESYNEAQQKATLFETEIRKELESYRKQAKAEADSLRAEADSLRAETDSLRAETESLRTKLDELEKERSTETVLAKAEADSFRAETESLRTKLDELEKERSTETILSIAKRWCLDLHVVHKSATTKASQLWCEVSLRNERCCVCGTRENLSRAHIVSDKEACKRHGLDYRCTSNMLVLCGSKDQEDTCHSLFDHRLMGFVFDRDTKKWMVFGGPHHGRYTDLVPEDSPRKEPHRRALHSHLALCFLQGEVFLNKIPSRNIDINLLTRIEEWQARVSPPRFEHAMGETDTLSIGGGSEEEGKGLEVAEQRVTKTRNLIRE